MIYILKSLYILIVASEIIVIIYYLYQVNVLFQKTKFLQTAVVSPIRNEHLIFPENTPLKYYYEPKPNFVIKDDSSWLDQSVYYTINSDSLNERSDYPLEKGKNTYRIITLGDSFTFGQSVDTKDNWTEQLEVTLNATCVNSDITTYEVINFAERGYDIAYNIEKYKRRGIKYKPDLILWFESGSGFSRINELIFPTKDTIKQQLSPADVERAIKNGDYVQEWTLALKQLNETYTETQIFEQIYAYWYDFRTIKGDTPLLVNTFSTLNPKLRNHMQFWIGNMPNARALNTISDIYPNSVLKDGHPNAEGHTIIAKDMLTALEDLSFISGCRKF